MVGNASIYVLNLVFIWLQLSLVICPPELQFGHFSGNYLGVLHPNLFLSKAGEMLPAL
jgi:hypothetical protein